MKKSCFLLVVLLSANPCKAADLQIGQTLYSNSLHSQSVETIDLHISVTGFYQEKENSDYRVTLRNHETDRAVLYHFPQEGGRMPELHKLGFERYCDIPVLLLTLRDSPPRYADGRTYSYTTHVFLEDSLAFVDTVFAPVEDFSLHADGTDLGFPYEMPQRIGVRCGTDPGGPPFTFYERHP